MKKKTYVLMISRVFPACHPKHGQLTYFKEQILHKIDPDHCKFFVTNRRRVGITEPGGKIHTIRANYDMWARRAEQVNTGKAVISLRQWTGSPYNYKRDGSKQDEFLQLKEVCVQKIRIEDHRLNVDLGKEKNVFASVDNREVSFSVIAKNDGLTWQDCFHWFGGKPWKKLPPFEGCVIHFTEFKYL